LTVQEQNLAQADDTSALVERLISVHGQEGVCPTASDWRAILALEGQGPFHLLNLLKFKQHVDTPNGAMLGAVAYAKYTSGVAKAFARVGGQRIFFGRVEHMFAFGTAASWDAAIVTRYPSARALADMWLDPEFVAAHENRIDGVERSQVLIFDQ
jgi:uncharacterized protein (DUF1330 family)